MTLIAFLCAQLFYTVSPDPSALLRGKGRGETKTATTSSRSVSSDEGFWSPMSVLRKRRSEPVTAKGKKKQRLGVGKSGKGMGWELEKDR